MTAQTHAAERDRNGYLLVKAGRKTWFITPYESAFVIRDRTGSLYRNAARQVPGFRTEAAAAEFAATLGA